MRVSPALINIRTLCYFSKLVQVITKLVSELEHATSDKQALIRQPRLTHLISVLITQASCSHQVFILEMRQ